MTPTSRLGIGLVLLAAVLLVTSTVGVFAVTGTRGADVVTGTDASAYLGIDRFDHELTPGRHEDVPLVELQNNFPGRLTEVVVTVTDPEPRPPRPAETAWSVSLDVGERESFSTAIVCGGPGDRTERWTVEIAASGPEIAFTAVRSMAIGCESPAGPPGPPSGGPGEGSPPPNGSGDQPPGRPGR